MTPLENSSPANTDLHNLRLPLPRRAELWGGRLAMMGFVMTVAAIALRAHI